MITFRQKGDFSKATRFFERAREVVKLGVLDKYGRAGVESGLTASSWSYEIKQRGGSAVIEYHNSNINKGVPIAIILQYGHGTGTGGWVEGRDYINPAIQPVFDKIVEDAWKEVVKL